MSHSHLNLDLYRCPRSHRPLKQDGECLHDSGGEHRYPIRDGIPVLLRYGSAESPGDRALLSALNSLADSVGCSEAIRQTYGDGSNLTSYVTDVSRSIFMDILPLSTQSSVLEIGPGLGQFTPLLAARSRHVSALEVVEGQAAFTRRRCLESNRTNVSVAAGGDDCVLPYRTASLDGVIMNLVLEWCGMRETRHALIDSQRRILREIYRVLTPGGFAFIATKNRFALRYLLGKRDGHAHKMRFGHALPRWLMNALLKARGRDRPLGMLHSHRTLVLMLKRAGFKSVRAYWAAPNMRRPSCYVPADSRSIREARRVGGFKQANGRILSRIMPLVPAALVPHVAYGNVMIVHK
jgi:SAM-dependent methyltransferase